MSDEQGSDSNESGESDEIANRLASLRASIRSSKSRTAPVTRATPPVEADPNDEPPPQPARQTGEKFITGDLHRVEPTGEHAAVVFAPDELLSQMDVASEAAESLDVGDEPSDAYQMEPTVVHRIEDFAGVQGTPLYMSPEQCRNDAVDRPTDIYSLGVMMFELLEGVPPFMAHSMEEVLYKHMDAPIPAQRSEFTPEPVRELVARMLAKDPADRPDMAEIVALLQQHVSVASADVLGLEEESWSVSAIEESSPLVVTPQPEAPTALPVETERKVPIWLFGLFGIVLLGIIALVVSSGGSPDEQEPAVTVIPPTAPETVIVNRTNAEPVEIAVTPDAGPTVEAPEVVFDMGVTEQVAEEPVEEPVEEVVEPDPEPTPKPRKRTKRPKKTPALKEIRL